MGGIILLILFMANYAAGYYCAWLTYGPFVGKAWMTEKCIDCGGSGQNVGFSNNITDCVCCDGYGRYVKTGFRYWFMRNFFKWTSL